MTCIAALVDKNGRIWMGGDSASTYGKELRMLSASMPKVCIRFDNNETSWIFGAAGPSRLKQIITWEMDLLQAPTAREDLPDFLAKKFRPHLYETLLKGAYLEKEGGMDKMKGAILFGLKGRLFMVDGSFCIMEEVQPFTAIGSGEDVAFGSLFSTQGESDPEKRIDMALRAAEARTSDVRRPFTILHT